MSCCKITSVCLSFAAKCWRCFTNALMTLRHYAFTRQHRTQFSEDVYAFVLWRYVAEQIWRVKELFVPGHLVSPLVCRGPWMSTVVLYCWCHSDDASVLLYFTLVLSRVPLNIGSAMNFHSTRYLWNECVFYIPSIWRGNIKQTTSFINTVWNENLFQILFITWSFRKISIFHDKNCILRKFRHEASCFTRRHNAPLYDVTDKGVRNCSKKCFVTCVILENLWNGFMKGKIMW